MQTFLPYKSFTDSVKVLDSKRLGKMRVEAFQMLKARYTGKGWVNHPATLQYAGFESYLALYGQTCCEQWIARGFKDSLLLKFNYFLEIIPFVNYPNWVDCDEYHLSHRHSLYYKDPGLYGSIWPIECEGLTTPEEDGFSLYWPSKVAKFWDELPTRDTPAQSIERYSKIAHLFEG